jgi:hypothetical protein
VRSSHRPWRLLLLPLLTTTPNMLAGQLREGRQLRTRTISNNNNPEFDETFR